MRAVVVGAGAWGTAFAHLLRSRGHDVIVARRGALADAPFAEAELVVLAVPSHAFREVLVDGLGKFGVTPAAVEEVIDAVKRWQD